MRQGVEGKPGGALLAMIENIALYLGLIDNLLEI